MEKLAREIINGRRLNEEDDLAVFLHADLQELQAGADMIRRELCGNRVDLCCIINGRGGRCSEDCKFCAQSGHHATSCETYGFLETDAFVSDCKKMEAQGVDRYSIVTSGRMLAGADLDKAVASYSALHESCPDIKLCASHGLMTEANLKRLHEVGVTTYHTNLETSARFFPEICSTHTYEDKLEEIRRARAAGMEICSGGIFGMGETWQDRFDMALLLSRLFVVSIPMNFLIPIKGTPLEGRPRLDREEILRIVAIFRYFNPEAYIRIAAGRNYFPDGGRELFCSGANATLTGDMLTTVGNCTAQDREMLKTMGFIIKEEKKDGRS